MRQDNQELKHASTVKYPLTYGSLRNKMAADLGEFSSSFQLAEIRFRSQDFVVRSARSMASTSSLGLRRTP